MAHSLPTVTEKIPEKEMPSFDKSGHGGKMDNSINGGCKSTEVCFEEEQEWTPPDGGYGWVIVFGGALTLLIFSSYNQIGIFLLELEKYFQVSKATISWINAAHTVTGRVCGICFGQVLAHIGSRWLAGIGIILLSGGYFLSSFVDNVPLLFCTFGFIASLGSGCLYTTASATVQQYFSKKRSLANGLMMIGIATGAFIWPPLAQHLIETYSWRNTFRIDAAIILSLGAVIVVIMKPPGNQRTCNPCKRAGKLEEEEETERSCGFLNLWDLSLITQPALVFYWFGMIFMAIGHLVNGIYLPVRGELLGISASSAAWQASVFGICGGVGLPIFAAVGNIPGADRLLMALVGIGIGAVLILSSTLLTSSIALLVYSGFVGFLGAIYQSVIFVVAVDMAGVDKIAVAGGFQTAAYGLAHLILHPTAGWLLDITNNPQVPFYLAGVSLIVSFICVGCAFMTRRKLTAHNLDLSCSPFKTESQNVPVKTIEVKKVENEVDTFDCGEFVTYM